MCFFMSLAIGSVQWVEIDTAQLSATVDLGQDGQTEKFLFAVALRLENHREQRACSCSRLCMLNISLRQVRHLQITKRR